MRRLGQVVIGVACAALAAFVVLMVTAAWSAAVSLNRTAALCADAGGVWNAQASLCLRREALLP